MIRSTNTRAKTIIQYINLTTDKITVGRMYDNDWIAHPLLPVNKVCYIKGIGA